MFGRNNDWEEDLDEESEENSRPRPKKARECNEPKEQREKERGFRRRDKWEDLKK